MNFLNNFILYAYKIPRTHRYTPCTVDQSKGIFKKFILVRIKFNTTLMRLWGQSHWILCTRYGTFYGPQATTSVFFRDNDYCLFTTFYRTRTKTLTSVLSFNFCPQYYLFRTKKTYDVIKHLSLDDMLKYRQYVCTLCMEYSTTILKRLHKVTFVYSIQGLKRLAIIHFPDFFRSSSFHGFPDCHKTICNMKEYRYLFD